MFIEPSSEIIVMTQTVISSLYRTAKKDISPFINIGLEGTSGD